MIIRTKIQLSKRQIQKFAKARARRKLPALGPKALNREIRQCLAWILQETARSW